MRFEQTIHHMCDLVDRFACRRVNLAIRWRSRDISRTQTMCARWHDRDSSRRASHQVYHRYLLRARAFAPRIKSRKKEAFNLRE